jgi:hypothetical protein
MTWRTYDDWKHLRWYVVDEDDNEIVDIFGENARERAETIVSDHNAASAAAARIEALDREVAILRGAGGTVSAHLYAIVNPGTIPIFVRQAMIAFEERAAPPAAPAQKPSAPHDFMSCQPGSCALPHPMPNPEESGCHWPYGNVFFGGSKTYHQGDPICVLTEEQHRSAER